MKFYLKIIFNVLFLLLPVVAFTQTKYLIYFKDKGESDKKYFKKEIIEAELLKTFSNKAIERRKKALGNEIFSYGDYFIYKPYIDNLKELNVQIVHELTWFNAVSAYLDENQKQLISSLPFVEKVEKVKVFKSSYRDESIAPLFELNKLTNNYGPSFDQNNLSQIPEVHSRGIRGENVLIGLLDTGFRWKTHEALMSTKVIAEYDFIFGDSITANQPGDVAGQDAHGTQIMSIVAGKKDGRLIGVAYDANYILAKTEDIRSERRVEEDNYARALIWMEQQGVDVTSSSLGYSEFDDPNESYTYQDMNGSTTIVARAVDSAFVRGVVTVTAAGNEFMSPWKYIVSPADARYVLAVGAVSSSSIIAPFSSRGPTSDGRIKPDVCAMGMSVYTATTNGFASYSYASGTSASTPIVAGIVGLLISHYSEINQYQVRDAIRLTASQSDKPDTVYGWGIARAKEALSFPLIVKRNDGYYLLKTIFENQTINKLNVVIFSEDNSIYKEIELLDLGNNFKFEVKLPNELNEDDVYKFYFTYHTPTRTVRIPEKSELNYSFHLLSKKVFAPRKSLNVVRDFVLYQNYPNPFNGITRFRFDLPTQQWITLEIYDVLGRKVKTLLKDVGVSRGNNHEFVWDGTDDTGRVLSSGVYFYRFLSQDYNVTKKLTILR